MCRKQSQSLLKVLAKVYKLATEVCYRYQQHTSITIINVGTNIRHYRQTSIISVYFLKLIIFKPLNYKLHFHLGYDDIATYTNTEKFIL